MFIQQAFKAQHEWWRYIIGIFITVMAMVLGQIPLTAAIIIWGDVDLMTLDQTTMMQALEPNLFFFLLLLSYACGLVGLWFAIKYVHRQPILQATTARRKFDWNRVFFGFGVVAVITIVLFGIDYYNNPEAYVWNFQPIHFLILVLITLVMVPLQTSWEEYLFRGYLMQGLGILARNRWVPLFLTSIVFGLLHLSNPEVGQLGEFIMAVYIGIGFMLGIMTLMDEGMELALGYHAGNNMIAALLVTADWTAFQTHSMFKDVSDPSVAGYEIIAQVLIFYPAVLLLMGWKYNWTDWRGKLFGKVAPPPVEEPVLPEEGRL